MSTLNTVLIGAAMAFVSAAMATISTNVWAGIAEFVVAIVAIVVYEKLPPTTPTIGV